MRKIRKKRLTAKRKRYLDSVNTLKIGVINYILIGLFILFITPTMAGFTDTEILLGTITATKQEEEYDESRLTFGSLGGSCKDGIFAVVNNVGEGNMRGTTSYYVYYNTSANPNSWEYVTTGTLEEIKKGKSLRISYSPVKTGLYKFMVLQRPAFPGEAELWSNEIIITCNK